jgi:hypothetical protein
MWWPFYISPGCLRTLSYLSYAMWPYELLRFWTFSIVMYSREWKTRHFGNWTCFLPQVKEGEIST